MRTESDDRLHLACLCAAWCRTCDGYRPVFEAAAAALRPREPALVAHWIDIEDEAALLGDVDVETFPTLVLARGRQVLFAGPLTPQPETLARVLRSALASATPTSAADPEIQAFVERLSRRGEG